jgi:hypothetical protein
MRNRTVLLAVVALTASFIMASAASANCDPARWTNPNDPHNAGKYMPAQGVGNAFVNLKPEEGSGVINADGNIEVTTVQLVNDPNGVCTVDLFWEFNCERQEYRFLSSRSFYDKDTPTDRDRTADGDKVWASYTTPIGMRLVGNVAKLFCSRKDRLPGKPPGK